MTKDSKVVPLKQDAMSSASSAAITAAIEPVLASTREDRRIILAKLQEVYVDEKVGYKAGWNDKRIATDLGVQAMWVAQLRDEHFGPDIDERHTQALADAEAVLAAIRQAAIDVEPLHKLLRDLFAKGEQIERQIAELKK